MQAVELGLEPLDAARLLLDFGLEFRDAPFLLFLNGTTLVVIGCLLGLFGLIRLVHNCTVVCIFHVHLLHPLRLFHIPPRL
ncbi:hypothetical protein PG988_003529 [Apiospora saccharicola]